jgi:hypothetical protein
MSTVQGAALVPGQWLSMAAWCKKEMAKSERAVKVAPDPQSSLAGGKGRNSGDLPVVIDRANLTQRLCLRRFCRAMSEDQVAQRTNYRKQII